MRARRLQRFALVPLLGLGLLAGCTNTTSSASRAPSVSPSPSLSSKSLSSRSLSSNAASTPSSSPAATPAGLPGMPALLDPHDAYAADRPGRLSATVRKDPRLVYVPNSGSNTVDVISQRTYKIIRHFSVGREPQHVVPAYDLKTLYVNEDLSGSLTPINPATGKPTGRHISVPDPYNLYFTPNGRYAMVMAEARREVIFTDPHTFAIKHVLHVPQCAGLNHVDFSLNGRYFIATCEFDGSLIKVDTQRQRVLGTIHLGSRYMPQDIKIAPDGSVWYVADMIAGGTWLIDGAHFRKIGFVPTGAGAHGLYPSRDSRTLYVSNRNAGSVSLIDFATRKVRTTWRIPGGGSPDMGGLNAEGTVLWLSGRYNSVVYAFRTSDGHLLAKIPVGTQPHGLCVWPQPGRYSLGHTGILR